MSTRPRWDWEPFQGKDWDKNNLGLSPEFVSEITEIIDAPQSVAFPFIADLAFRMLFFRKMRDQPEPTPNEQAAAARSIQGDVEKLRLKLSGGAGGLIDFFSDEVAYQLPTLLEELSKICSQVQNYVASGTMGKPGSARDVLARAVYRSCAWHIRKTPTGYCSEDNEENRGKYARVLAACFRECEEVVTPSVLRNLVLDTVRLYRNISLPAQFRDIGALD